MRILNVVFGSLALVLPSVNANFDIYYGEMSVHVLPGVELPDAYYIYGNPPTCDQVSNAVRWLRSHNYYYWEKGEDMEIGIVCYGEGGACEGKEPLSDISGMELNFRIPDYLMAIGSGGWDLTRVVPPGEQLAGEVVEVGKCFPFPGDSYECNLQGDLGVVKGKRLFRCLTDYTADEINAQASRE